MNGGIKALGETAAEKRAEKAVTAAVFTGPVSMLHDETAAVDHSVNHTVGHFKTNLISEIIEEPHIMIAF